jgi:hypothetical protein
LFLNHKFLFIPADALRIPMSQKGDTIYEKVV